MLQKFLHCRRSDSQFIASMQREIAFWDRWRHYVTFGGLALLCGGLWYLSAAWQAAAEFGPGDPLFIDKLNRMWMLISLGVGIGLGLNVAGLVSYILKSSLGGYRAERMLLKLHAELDECRTSHDAERFIGVQIKTPSKRSASI